ncbi:MAG: DUF5615 family PIN-like protein [Pseudomonadota bacterium]
MQALKLKFLIDQNLPPKLMSFFEDKGHQGYHTRDLNMALASDEVLFHLALQENYIIVTKDEDFQNLITMNNLSPQMIWIRLGNMSTASLLNALDQNWAAIEASLKKDTPIIELVSA